MDLTQVGEATEKQRDQGLVEWAQAFNASSWEEMNRIENAGVKEAAKTMQIIMSNPTEREMIRTRADAQRDWITMVNSERLNGKIETLAGLVRKNLLSIENAAAEVNMSVGDFASRARLNP